MVLNICTNAGLVDFLHAAQKCKGDIFLYTKNGDALNLSSTLTQYVLIAALPKEPELLNNEIRFTNKDDIAPLRKFIK